MPSRLSQLQTERLSNADLLAKGIATLPVTKPVREEQWVYFIEAEGTGLVKVGYATNARRRIASLRTMSPVSLNVLATMPGGREKEAELHALLEDHRHHGEWFRRCPLLDDIINGLIASRKRPK